MRKKVHFKNNYKDEFINFKNFYYHQGDECINDCDAVYGVNFDQKTFKFFDQLSDNSTNISYFNKKIKNVFWH